MAAGNIPEWLERALSTPGTSRSVEVAGCPIHYLEWGRGNDHGLLFVPASGCHAHWFDHVAPLLADQFHVVAIDLSGCGDSGRRSSYTNELIVAEIMGVCAHSGMLGRPIGPVLVGHSAGAQFALRAAIAHSPDLLGVIAVDGLRYVKLEKDTAVQALGSERRAPPPTRIHATLEDAVSRFRLKPQPLAPISAPHILAHIARHSYCQVNGGWTAKFDPSQTSTISLALELKDSLKDLGCRSAAIYGEHSHLADETAPKAIAAASCGKTVSFALPGTTHYPMIDSPLAFVSAVKGLALCWISDRVRTRPSGTTTAEGFDV